MNKIAATKAAPSGMNQRCNMAFGSAVAKLVTGLGDSDWLVGESMTAADVTAAAVVFRVQRAEMFPLAFDAANCLAPWVERVMAYDRVPK